MNVNTIQCVGSVMFFVRWKPYVISNFWLQYYYNDLIYPDSCHYCLTVVLNQEAGTYRVEKK